MVKFRPNLILEGVGARWAAALLIYALATALRAALDPFVSDHLPLLPYLPALAAVGLVAGVWPGLAAMLVSAVTLVWLWDASLAVLLLFLAAGGAALAVSGYARSVVRDAHLLRGRLHVALTAGRMAAWEWNVKTGALSFSEGAEAVFGATWHDLDGVLKLAHPDDLPRVRQVVEAALKHGEHYTFVNRMHRADNGQLCWIETHGYVHRQHDGKPWHVTGVTIDVTERQLALEASQATQSRLELALRCGDVIAWECDEDLRYTWVCNPKLGLKAEGMVGTKVGDITRPRRSPEFVAAVEEARRDGVFRQFQVTIAHEGQTLHYLCAVQPQKDATGRVTKLIGASTDITPLHRTQAQLETEIRRKDTFLATLAHELRNPMAPIRYAIAMLDKGAAEQQRAQALEVIQRQAAHMARLLDDLLDMSRITRNVIELKREGLDLREVVRQATESAMGSMQALGHQVATTIARAPVWVDGDGTRLQQVLGNLLDNAAKYTLPGGRITVLLEAEDRHAVLKVCDSGLGLSEPMRSKVFELFTQMHRSEVPQSGLGIGLAVVKQLVELHGGSIEAESPGLNQGSTFVVRLPLCDAPMQRTMSSRIDLAEQAATESAAIDARSSLPMSAEEPPPAMPAQARRVLIVDDNRDGADTLAIFLGVGDLEVCVAYDGREALAAFDAHLPELVLLDLGLPDATGFDVARAMRERARGRPLKIVALTGWGDEADRARSSEAGFDRHLVKPIEPVELHRQVHDLLAFHGTGTAVASAGL